MGNPQPPTPLLPHGEGGESQNPAAPPPSPLPHGGAGEGQNPAAPSRLERVAFDSRGLITAVVQDASTREVLMVAWMNADALRLTQETGEAHFWSRSRGELWHKGATSGHIMHVRDIRVDCDADTLLLLVDPAGPACHTGAPSCFFRTLKDLTDTP